MTPAPDASSGRSKLLPVSRPSLPPLAEYSTVLRRAWAAHWLTNNGPLLREFEQRLCRYLPARYVDVVVNGTLALQLAYRTVMPRRGVVVTTPFTFAATTTALVWEGYTPRFADVDPETFNLDVGSVEAALGTDTVGVVAVHVFGNPSGADDLASLTTRKGVGLVFDAAHAFGVRLRSRDLFSLGDASTLSFHATKSFHTFEGGAVVTPRSSIAGKVRRQRSFGMAGSEVPREPGINAKLNEAQAAMGLVNLRHIDGWIRERRKRWTLYRELLGAVDGVEFQRVADCRYNYTYMPVLLPDERARDRVARDLERHGIASRKYFFPLTSRAPFLPKSARAACPVAARISSRILVLPLFPDLSFVDVHRICSIVRASLT